MLPNFFCWTIEYLYFVVNYSNEEIDFSFFLFFIPDCGLLPPESLLRRPLEFPWQATLFKMLERTKDRWKAYTLRFLPQK